VFLANNKALAPVCALLFLLSLSTAALREFSFLSLVKMKASEGVLICT